MAYVPPHLRNKKPVPPPQRTSRGSNAMAGWDRTRQEEEEKQEELRAAEKLREITKENFPELVKNPTPRVCGGGGAIPYNKLAENLQTIDDEMKVQEELKKQYKARTAHKVVLPTFYNTGNHTDEEPQPEEVVVPKKEPDPFEWRIVDTQSKKQSKKLARERAKQNQTFKEFENGDESENSRPRQKEDTVWDSDDGW